VFGLRIPHQPGDVPVLHGPGKIAGVQQGLTRSYRGEQELDPAKDKVICVAPYPIAIRWVWSPLSFEDGTDQAVDGDREALKRSNIEIPCTSSPDFDKITFLL
jgi:hypothetical protein